MRKIGNNLIWQILLCWLAASGWFWQTSAQAQEKLALTTSINKLSAADAAFGQPEFEHIDDEESFPGGIVSALAQDPRGFLWAGTPGGLFRYDGYRWRRFTHAANRNNSLVGNTIQTLWLAPDGQMWIGTTDGLSVLDTVSEQFVNFRHDANKENSLSVGAIRAITGDNEGGVWIATGQGLDYRPRGSKDFVHFRQDKNDSSSLASNQVRSLLVDRQGRLWVGSMGGLQRRTLDGQHFEAIGFDANDKAELAEKAILSLFEAEDGKMWLGTSSQGAGWLEPGTHKLHWLPPDPANPSAANASQVSKIMQIQAGQIWIATAGEGIYVVSPENGRLLQHLHHDPALPGSLAYDSVETLLLDRAGLLWIGTLGGGLQRMNTQNKMISLLRHSPTQPKGLSSPDVRHMLELSNGRILFGSASNGVDIFGFGGSLVSSFRAGPAQSGGLPDAAITGLAQTADDTIWVATEHAGMVRLTTGSTLWQPIPGLPGTQVRKLYAARNGELWVGTNLGVARWQPGRTRFEIMNDESGNPLQMPVNAFAEDVRGSIWVGTSNGLWVMEPNSLGWRGIHAQAGKASSLVSDEIEGLLCDQHGRIWVSTTKGLERLSNWDGQTAQFEHISTLLGQAGRNFGSNLLEDQKGRIWTGDAIIIPGNARGFTANSAAQAMQLVTLSKADGLDIGGHLRGAFTRTRNGLLLFGGTTGVAIINPALFQPWTYPAPVVATGLRINGQPVHLGQLAQLTSGPEPTKLILSPEQRNFALEFAILDYTNPKKNQFQYRLLGYDNNWIDSDATHRNAEYSNLEPGNYRLQVRGSNRTGTWSPQELSIPIQVLPQYWQTKWFLALMALLTLFAIYAARRWHLGGLQRSKKQHHADMLNLSKTGQQLGVMRNIEQICEQISQQACEKLDPEVFRIGIYHEARAEIEFVWDISNGERLPASTQSMSEQDRPAVWCIREARALEVGKSSELINYVSSILPASPGSATETVVYLPLMADQHILGCISAQSVRQHAFNENQLEFLRILANYAAMALANASVHTGLVQADEKVAKAEKDLAQAQRNLKKTQHQMQLQGKMATLGEISVGVAQEITPPIGSARIAAEQLLLELQQFRQYLDQSSKDGSSPDTLASFARRFQGLELHVHTLLANTGHIQNMIRDLRSLSKLEQAEKQPVHLSECLNAALHLVNARWLDKVDFIIEVINDPVIECWPVLLNELLMNLLINACQAMEENRTLPGLENVDAAPDKGKLWLRLYQHNEHMVVECEDNGIGIADEIKERIMEPFFTTKTVGVNTGLGLSIALGIAKKHEGNLTFTSKPGKGSCFIVTLPLIMAAQQPEDMLVAGSA